MRGMAYVRVKDYERAMPDFDKAIKADDDNALALSARSPISGGPLPSARRTLRPIARAPWRTERRATPQAR